MRVVDVVGGLAAGDSIEDILEDFPHIALEDIRACLAYAAEAASFPLTQAAE